MEAQEKLKLIFSILLLLAGLIGYYLLPESQALAKYAALFGGGILAVVVFFVSAQGRRFVVYGRESIAEAKKVVWPTRKEATQMTGLVFAFVAILATFMWLVDSSLSWLFYDLILKRG